MILLPVLTLAILTCGLRRRGHSFADALLMALVACGVFTLATTELLGLLRAVGRDSVCIAWTAFLVASSSLLLRHPTKTGPTNPPLVLPWRLLAALALPVFGAGLVALVAAPNDWDSMSYHLARVMHWRQNGHVGHYPTNILRQLYQPPFAEFALLHTVLLSGSDRFVNLPQWLSAIGCIAAVWRLALDIAGTGRAAAFAAVFVATLPMGLLQAGTTQNDYVTSLWVVVFAVFLHRAARSPSKRSTWFVAACGMGLAIATKATALIYTAAVGIPFGLLAVLRGGRAAFTRLVFLLVTAAAIAAPHYLRNVDAFGNAAGPESVGYLNQRMSPAIAVSSVVRNMSNHLATPVEAVNRVVERAVFALHDGIGVDASDPRTTLGRRFEVSPHWNHSDYAGNPVQLVSLLVLVVLALLRRRALGRLDGAGVALAMMPLLGALLFMLMLKWQVWNSRLHLPLFVLAAPSAGLVADRLDRGRLVPAMVIAMLAVAPAYVLRNGSKRLLSGSRSVLTVPRDEQYFADHRGLAYEYVRMTDRLRASGAERIGLIVTEGFPEYPMWPLLDVGAGSPIRIEHVVADPANGRRTAAFAPDALVVSPLSSEEVIVVEGIPFRRVWAGDAIAVHGRR